MFYFFSIEYIILYFSCKYWVEKIIFRNCRNYCLGLMFYGVINDNYGKVVRIFNY